MSKLLMATGGAGGGGGEPAPGMLFEYDATNLSSLFQDILGTTPVTTLNDPVRHMVDVRGSGVPLVSFANGNFATYKDDTPQPSVFFDGTAAALDDKGLHGDWVSAGQDFTIFSFYRSDVDPNIFLTRYVTSPDRRQLLYGTVDGQKMRAVLYGELNAASFQDVKSATDTGATDFRQRCLEFDSSVAIDSGSTPFTMALDGVPDTPLTVTGDFVPPITEIRATLTPATGLFCTSSASVGPALFFQGGFTWMLVYPKLLTPAEMTQTLAYIASKFP